MGSPNVFRNKVLFVTVIMNYMKVNLLIKLLLIFGLRFCPEFWWVKNTINFLVFTSISLFLRAYKEFLYFCGISWKEINTIDQKWMCPIQFEYLLILLNLPYDNLLKHVKSKGNKLSPCIRPFWIGNTSLGFPVSASEWWDGSQVSKLLLHASCVALPT